MTIINSRKILFTGIIIAAFITALLVTLGVAFGNGYLFIAALGFYGFVVITAFIIRLRMD